MLIKWLVLILKIQKIYNKSFFYILNWFYRSTYSTNMSILRMFDSTVYDNFTDDANSAEQKHLFLSRLKNIWWEISEEWWRYSLQKICTKSVVVVMLMKCLMMDGSILLALSPLFYTAVVPLCIHTQWTLMQHEPFI